MDVITVINYTEVRTGLRTLTGIFDGDDEQLKQAYNLASGYLYALVAGHEVDTVKFEAIAKTALMEATIYRFNRLSEEGMQSTNQDGESKTWEKDPMDKWAGKIKETIKNEVMGWKLIMASTRNNYERKDLGYRVPLLANGIWYYQTIM